MDPNWLKYGALGLLAGCLAWGISVLWKKIIDMEIKHKAERAEWLDEHKKERDEWRDTIEKQFDKIEVRDKKSDRLLMDIKFLLGVEKKRKNES